MSRIDHDDEMVTKGYVSMMRTTAVRSVLSAGEEADRPTSETKLLV